MKPSNRAASRGSRGPARLLGILGIVAVNCLAISSSPAAPSVVVWDTMSRPSEPSGTPDRSGWKMVPTDLLALEIDPPKASSDPGYYGREFIFQGDVAVENRHLTAEFRSATGRVLIRAKADPAASADAISGGRGTDEVAAEFVPVPPAGSAGRITRTQIVRNAGDEVVMEAWFSTAGSAEISVVFAFDRSAIIEIRPAVAWKAARFVGPIEYGIIPGFIGDDLIFGPADPSPESTLHVPAENVFVGLLRGGNRELIVTWPGAEPRVSLQRAPDQQDTRRPIESVNFDAAGGRSFYVAVLTAPGIWHRETLGPTYLEKDVVLPWKKPFPARWKTQLEEAGVKTTFAFRESRGQIWRGVPGSYSYPAWFDGENAFLHLSKKVPPKGESLIYFIEGQETPPSVSTPVDMMKATLGRPMCDELLDLPGRKLRTHHRRDGDGVRRACTCGCTEAIQAVFEAGEEVTRKQEIREALDDMIYFVEHHVARIDEYQHFAADMVKFLHETAGAHPELAAYLAGLEEIPQQILQEYNGQKENMKSPEHAADLFRQTLDLASRKDPNNLKAYMELLKAWRNMGGAQDYVVAQCHGLTRRLFQEAAYKAVNQPAAVAVAQEVRKRCKQCLRNPDGYEIWANY